MPRDVLRPTKRKRLALLVLMPSKRLPHLGPIASLPINMAGLVVRPHMAQMYFNACTPILGR